MLGKTLLLDDLDRAKLGMMEESNARKDTTIG